MQLLRNTERFKEVLTGDRQHPGWCWDRFQHPLADTREISQPARSFGHRHEANPSSVKHWSYCAALNAEPKHASDLQVMPITRFASLMCPFLHPPLCPLSGTRPLFGICDAAAPTVSASASTVLLSCSDFPPQSCWASAGTESCAETRPWRHTSAGSQGRKREQQVQEKGKVICPGSRLGQNLECQYNPLIFNNNIATLFY